MRKGGGKDKGSGFEREICAHLSQWITNGERTDVFWRSASSGGRATVAIARGKQIEYASSDIAPVHPAAYRLLDVFSIECKFYADLHLQDLPFPEKESNIAVFWRQVCRDAEAAERHPLLIAKQNRKPVLAGMRPRVFDSLTAGTMAHLLPTLISTGFDLLLVDYRRMFEALSPQNLDQVTPIKRKKEQCAPSTSTPRRTPLS